MKQPIEFRHICWLIRKSIWLGNGGVCVTRPVKGPALYEIRQKAGGVMLKSIQQVEKKDTPL